MDSATQSIVERLQKWSSCDVSDGLSRLGHVHGGFLEGLVMYSPSFRAETTKIVGPVFTVKFAPKADKQAPKVEGNYIDQIPKGAVVFISQPTPHINACYGGLMSLRAKYLGAAGVIIDGFLRDLQEHRDLEFPVFSKGTGTTAGNSVCFASEINVPIKLQSTIQEATINPSDYIIADLNGVVCVPADLVEKVLEVIPDIVGADEKCANAIRNGVTVKEAFKTYRGK
ncbi:ribonuclease E inhibitor RraA/Dimethylmenaquinone methyltransferase [Hypoxylon trugodes]|uniref:ribonuclease E inhibitor RraA/Dimethylmenaquinone methyltransferase n=1 Tax=Hypoxylon trugodes TaxID=326681 RepID=UPI00219AEC41|nr:ribonuclease E inhibitor RraA/Dimethylmenaquinone methyltransferase [Hypoxylon trugodes]KAI1387023.1 ribonuclease E inhibitor RraA/Dimethylmenaquinone methyltransferase [Hypoxylon trugodes]